MENLLYQILEIQSETGDQGAMQDFIYSVLDKHHIQHHTDSEGNIFAGDTEQPRPWIVAHMDTVHDIVKGQQLIPVEISGRITGILYPSMKQSGIGGDDKCGIFAALTLLLIQKANAAFFVDEEIGCVGSYAADLEPMKNALFILQADRRGNSDFVTDIGGAISSKAFRKSVKPFLKKYGFAPCNGMLTDVMALRDRNIGVSCANISAGYYNPHTSEEYIVIDDLNNTIELMGELCKHLQKRYDYTAPAPKPRTWMQPISNKPTRAQADSIDWNTYPRAPKKISEMTADEWEDYEIEMEAWEEANSIAPPKRREDEAKWKDALKWYK